MFLQINACFYLKTPFTSTILVLTLVPLLHSSFIMLPLLSVVISLIHFSFFCSHFHYLSAICNIRFPILIFVPYSSMFSSNFNVFVYSTFVSSAIIIMSVANLTHVILNSPTRTQYRDRKGWVGMKNNNDDEIGKLFVIRKFQSCMRDIFMLWK